MTHNGLPLLWLPIYLAFFFKCKDCEKCWMFEGKWSLVFVLSAPMMAFSQSSWLQSWCQMESCQWLTLGCIPVVEAYTTVVSQRDIHQFHPEYVVIVSSITIMILPIIINFTHICSLLLFKWGEWDFFIFSRVWFCAFSVCDCMCIYINIAFI